MEKLYKDRLTKLADFLETVKPVLFDLRCFVKRSDLLPSAIKKERPDCGATGCAIGFCPIVFPDNFVYMSDVVKLFGCYEYDYWAAKKFFNLEWKEIDYLFCPEEYNEDDWHNPLAVVARIREFVS